MGSCKICYYSQYPLHRYCPLASTLARTLQLRRYVGPFLTKIFRNPQPTPPSVLKSATGWHQSGSLCRVARNALYASMFLNPLCSEVQHLLCKAPPCTVSSHAPYHSCRHSSRPRTRQLNRRPSLLASVLR